MRDYRGKMEQRSTVEGESEFFTSRVFIVPHIFGNLITGNINRYSLEQWGREVDDVLPENEEKSQRGEGRAVQCGL